MIPSLYPEQMREILALIDELNAFSSQNEKNITLSTLLPILDSEGAYVLGYLIDEVGGAWSFRAATAEESDKTMKYLDEMRVV